MNGPVWLRGFVSLILGFAAVACWSAPAAANCTSTQRAAADRALRLSAADRAAAIATHLPWGVPQATGRTSGESVLAQRDYVIGYDADLRVPLWTAERVDAARIGKTPRSDCFRADPRLGAADASTPTDYREPLYDQGHMAPFANQSSSMVAGHNSFIMSNMAPQICQLNRGIWQILEEITRRWAAERGTVYVLSGSIFDRDGDGARDADAAAMRMRSSNGQTRVAVPSAFYKVIAVRAADGSVSTLSIILPHDESNPRGQDALDYLQAHVVTIAAIERVAGLDLFPQGQQPAESASLWRFGGSVPRSLCNL